MAKIENVGVEVLRVLCGSRAYGLHNDDSDYDYHSVFVAPTSKLLQLTGEIKNTSHVAGNEDNTAWEIGHFLRMAMKGNPTVLETFVAPIQKVEEVPIFYTTNLAIGYQLRNLFHHCLSKTAVYNSFRGYASSQLHKMNVEENPRRNLKAAIAYQRTMLHGSQLLREGFYTTKLPEEWIYHLRKFKDATSFDNELMCKFEEEQTLHEESLKYAFEHSILPDEPDVAYLNAFLLRVRKIAWDMKV